MKGRTTKLLNLALFLGLISATAFGQIATPPVIDGDGSDAVWATATAWDLLRQNTYTGVTDADDFSATIKVLWDADNIYCLLEEKDDVWDTINDQLWNRDHWSIYFDMNNIKQNGALLDDVAEPMDSVEFMLEKIWGVEAIYSMDPLRALTLGLLINNDTLRPGEDFVETIDAGVGYTLEIAVPFSTAGVTLESGKIIGFDTKVGDNDGTVLDGKLSLYQALDEGWHNSSYLGTAVLEADGSLSRVEVPPTVDGVKDPAWYNAKSYSLDVKNTYTGVTSAADFSGTVSLMHDADNIYVLLEEKDDVWDTINDQLWNRDHWSIYFDMNNIKQNGALLDDVAEPMDSVQFMLEKIWGVEAIYSMDPLRALTTGLLINNDTLRPGEDFAETINAGVGYTLELAVPFSKIGVPLTEGMVIGYDTKIGDNDGTVLDGKLSWHQNLDESWHNGAYMGNMKLDPLFFDLGALTAVPVEPKIDGVKDGLWAQANAMPLNRKNTYTGVTGAADFSGTVSALWDKDNFYVLLEEKDDIWDTINDQLWNRDHWSIYFDINNRKQNADLLDDVAEPMDSVQFMLEKIWGVEAIYSMDPLRAITTGLKINNDTLYPGVDFVEVINAGVGYTLELCVPFSKMHVDLSKYLNKKIGFDTKIGDNDGTVLDGKLSWNQLADESWHNASYMGEVVLMGNGTISGSPNNVPTITAIADVTLDEGATATVEVSAGDLDGDPLTITATSSAAAVATATIDGTTITVTGVAAGTANVVVAANDGKYGVARDTFMVTVNAVIEGVEGHDAAQFNMYPNPTTGVLNIIGMSEIEYVSITNVAGQTVAEIPVNAQRSVVDVNSLRNGMYIISVHFTSQATANRVFVKQ
jgi:hypothetical protein